MEIRFGGNIIVKTSNKTIVLIFKILNVDLPT